MAVAGWLVLSRRNNSLPKESIVFKVTGTRTS